MNKRFEDRFFTNPWIKSLAITILLILGTILFFGTLLLAEYLLEVNIFVGLLFIMGIVTASARYTIFKD